MKNKNKKKITKKGINRKLNEVIKIVNKHTKHLDLLSDCTKELLIDRSDKKGDPESGFLSIDIGFVVPTKEVALSIPDIELSRMTYSVLKSMKALEEIQENIEDIHRMKANAKETTKTETKNELVEEHAQ